MFVCLCQTRICTWKRLIYSKRRRREGGETRRQRSKKWDMQTFSFFFSPIFFYYFWSSLEQLHAQTEQKQEKWPTTLGRSYEASQYLSISRRHLFIVRARYSSATLPAFLRLGKRVGFFPSFAWSSRERERGRGRERVARSSWQDGLHVSYFGSFSLALLSSLRVTPTTAANKNHPLISTPTHACIYKLERNFKEEAYRRTKSIEKKKTYTIHTYIFLYNHFYIYRSRAKGRIALLGASSSALLPFFFSLFLSSSLAWERKTSVFLFEARSLVDTRRNNTNHQKGKKKNRGAIWTSHFL